MRNSSKTMLGVTLLEIMLVLAIAAMIIVMSIRYYQSASSNQQANAALSQVQAVMAAMDNLGMAGGYSNTNVTQANLEAILNQTPLTTPTGGAVTLGGTTATTYTMTFVLNSTICPNVLAKLSGTANLNPKITSASCSGGTLTFTYDATK